MLDRRFVLLRFGTAGSLSCGEDTFLSALGHWTPSMPQPDVIASGEREAVRAAQRLLCSGVRHD
jgi:hypothetical protein